MFQADFVTTPELTGWHHDYASMCVHANPADFFARGCLPSTVLNVRLSEASEKIFLLPNAGLSAR